MIHIGDLPDLNKSSRIETHEVGTTCHIGYNGAVDLDRIGRFRIERRLGRGGMGEVYKAYDERLGRWVALKSVHLGRELDQVRKDQLLQEARAIAALSHPSIAQIHDIATLEGRDYLVLEYIEGNNLAELIRSRQIDLYAALRIGLDIAKGLYAAHSQGIVHRDLKAANIIVTPHGRAKILDFGLAQVTRPGRKDAETVRPGELAGTLSAMSPEQVDKAAVDHRSDLFSFGTMLYEMLTQRHPFRSPTPLETIHKISCIDPAPAHRVEPEIPVAVSRLISRLLAKSPGSRPRSVIEAIRVLEMECDPPGEQTDSYPAFVSTRRRLALGAVALAFVAAIVLLGLRLTGSQEERVLHVAIMAPEIEEGAEAGRLPLLASAIRVAIHGSLATCPTIHTIENEEVDLLPGTAKERGTAVAADEIVLSEISRYENLCQVRFSRVAPQQGNTVRMDFFAVPLDDLRLLFDTVTARMRRLFPEHSLRLEFQSETARSEDYETLLTLRSELATSMPDTSWPRMQERARDLRRKAPDLIDAYLVELEINSRLRSAGHGTNARSSEILEQASQVDSRDLRPALVAIRSALSCGRLDEAEELIAEVTTFHPAHPDLGLLQARLARDRAQLDQAIGRLELLVEDRPSWRYLLELAQLELEAGDIEAARTHLEQGIARAPSALLLKTQLIELELMYGDIEKARELTLRLYNEAPNALQISLATIKMLDREYEDAISTLSEQTPLDGPGSSHLLKLASSQALAGHHDQAERTCRRALLLLESSAPARPGLRRAFHLTERAQCLAHLGEGRQAIAAVDEATRLAPESAPIHYQAAVVNAILGQAAAAEAAALRSLDRGMSPSHFNLSWFDSTEVPAIIQARSADGSGDRVATAPTLLSKRN